MKSAVVAFATCLATGMALSLSGVAVSQGAAIAVQCNSQRIVLPGFPMPAPKIGDDEMYVLIELPATATACAR